MLYTVQEKPGAREGRSCKDQLQNRIVLGSILVCPDFSHRTCHKYFLAIGFHGGYGEEVPRQDFGCTAIHLHLAAPLSSHPRRTFLTNLGYGLQAP